MRPKELVKAFVEAFNRADVEALANFYSEVAINHQVDVSAAINYIPSLRGRGGR